MWVADRRLWLTRDRTRVVEEGAPEAHWLLASGPGKEIPEAEARRYGLIRDEGPAVEVAAEQAPATPLVAEGAVAPATPKAPRTPRPSRAKAKPAAGA